MDMGWIGNKIDDITIAFGMFPKLKWLAIFYFIIAMLVMGFYLPFLKGIANFEIMQNIQPFYHLIAENFTVLRWGVLLIPAVILILGFLDVNDLYHEKLEKRGY